MKLIRKYRVVAKLDDKANVIYNIQKRLFLIFWRNVYHTETATHYINKDYDTLEEALKVVDALETYR